MIEYIEHFPFQLKVKIFSQPECTPESHVDLVDRQLPQDISAQRPLPRRYESIGSSDLSLTVEPKDNTVVLELERAQRK